MALFHWPVLEPLNPAFTAVSSVSSLLFRRLCLLRRGLPLPSRTSEVPGSLVLLLLRASQLSSPAQKRVIRAVKRFISDAMFKGREGFGVRTIDNLVLFN